LTRFYERQDWAARVKNVAEHDPLILERGLNIQLTTQQKPTPQPETEILSPQLFAHFEAAHQKARAMPKAQREQANQTLLDQVAPYHAVFNASLNDMRR
jgi:hypothetical protein